MLVVPISNLDLDEKLTLETVKNSMLNKEVRKKKKNMMPPHLIFMWLNPMARMITVDVSNTKFSKDKTTNPGEVKVKIETRSYLLLLWQAKSQEERCGKHRRDLAEGKPPKKNEQKIENGAAMTVEGEVEDYLVTEDEECYSVVRDDAMSWVLYLGASFHIRSQKEYFTSYTNNVTSLVGMVNSGSSTIVGRQGSICIETNTCCKVGAR
jgi:hypothetical protein